MSDWIQAKDETVREDSDAVIRRLMAEIKRLRSREAQAKTIILAAAVFVPQSGGWQAAWHRDADKWIADKQSEK